MKTVFLRVLEADDKASALRMAIQQPEVVRGKQRFHVDTASFASVPRSPFAYWVSDSVRDVFRVGEPLEATGRVVCSGATTNDDQRFVRLWFEVDPNQLVHQRQEIEQSRWCALAKGGEHSRYFLDLYLVVDWHQDGRSVKAHIAEYRGRRGWGYQWSAALNGYSNYFRPGLTWSRRSQRGLSLRALPASCVFGDKGPAVFVPEDRKTDLVLLLAITNSQAFRGLVAVQMAFGSYEVGVLERTPLPRIRESKRSHLEYLASRAWSLKRTLDTRTAISHAFTLPALLQVTGNTLTARAVAWAEHVHASEAEIGAIQAEIDARCFDLYGIDEADRRAIMESFGSTSTVSSEPIEAEVEVDEDVDEEDDEDEAKSGANNTSLVAELVSWAVGVAFGRFDVRLATGARALPSEPEPFGPLPVCSPAMLTGDNGLPLTIPPVGYPLAFSESGILVDDPGHRHDLTAAVRTVFDVVFGARADAIWQEAAALLDPKDHNLRTWLASDYFEHHIKRHSKSRRKAPIFWQLGVPSGLYSVWLYAHRLTRDSFFQLQNDVVATKLVHAERQLTSFVQHAGGSPSAKDRKEIAAQEIFVEELRALLDEVKRVAPLWSPTLDDGVVLTMAPLWRLVPQHKPWQKELKGKWDELCAGKYDWAYLAMHLWPERVVPKCATDRSLAIAHGQEDVFWAENTDGKWQRRARLTRHADEIVRERSSPAVKTALKNLLDSQVATGGTSSKKRKGLRP